MHLRIYCTPLQTLQTSDQTSDVVLTTLSYFPRLRWAVFDVAETLDRVLVASQELSQERMAEEEWVVKQRFGQVVQVVKQRFGEEQELQQLAVE